MVAEPLPSTRDDPNGRGVRGALVGYMAHRPPTRLAVRCFYSLYFLLVFQSLHHLFLAILL